MNLDEKRLEDAAQGQVIPMRIVVLGGAGFVGGHLVDALVQQGHQVRILDSLDPQVHPTGQLPAYVNAKAEFLRQDIRDIDALRRGLAGAEVPQRHPLRARRAWSERAAQGLHRERRYTGRDVGEQAATTDEWIHTCFSLLQRRGAETRRRRSHHVHQMTTILLGVSASLR